MISLFKITDCASWEKEIRQFIISTPFGRFMSDRRIEFKNSVEFELINLKKYTERGNYIIAANEKSEIQGLIGFHFSQWDSDVFLKRVAILQFFLVKEVDVNIDKAIANQLIEQFHNWINENQINVVITKLDTQYFTPILTLQQHGYILFECVTFRSLEINNSLKSIGEGIKFRYAVESDNETLKQISLNNTFSKSHFYLDTNFDTERVELMYAHWIESALKSKQKIVIVEDNNQIAGVFIYDLVDYSSVLNRKIGVWKSAFVDSNFRDKGIGLKLFRVTLQSCINDGVDVVDSSLVEKNIVSQSFHDKLGFRLVNTLYTLHKWFD